MMGLVSKLVAFVLNTFDLLLFYVLYYLLGPQRILANDQLDVLKQFPQQSVEVGDEPENPNETIPRRSVLSPDKLLSSPHESIQTMNELFEYAAKLNADKPCLGKRDVIRLHRTKRRKKDWIIPEFSPLRYESYSKIRQRVHHFASGLTHYSGLNSDDRFCIFEDTRIEWFIALQSCFRYNITVVTAYAGLGEAALISALNETNVTAMLVNENYLEKIVNLIAPACPKLKYIIYCKEFHEGVVAEQRLTRVINTLQDSFNINVLSFDEVECLGLHLAYPPIIRTQSKNDSLALIMYTSGTTSDPKGVMVTHKNILAITTAVDIGATRTSGQQENSGKFDVVYCAYLPLAHILEMAAEHFVLVRGGCIAYGRSRTLTGVGAKPCGDLTSIRPTVFTGVPRIFDTIKKSALGKINTSSSLLRFLFNTAYNARLKAIQNKRDTPLWNFLVFRKFKQLVGGRLQVCFSGGAPLSKETQEFIRVCFGCPTIQGYGLTETSAAATVQSIFHPFKPKCVGPPIPCSEIKLRSVLSMGYSVDHHPPKGEILVRGPSVTLGYFNREELTKEVFLPGGWFATGDIGRLNSDGTFSIIDRKKNLVKLSHGEYIALERLEAVYGNSPFVVPNGIMVFADPMKSDFPVAIALVQKNYVKTWAHQNNVEVADVKELCQNKQFQKAVLKDLKQQAKNSQLKRFEEIRDVRVFTDEWTPENAMLTAAYKLKRTNIARKYKKWIEEMYSAAQ